MNGHGDVMDESFDASADKHDVNVDIKTNVHNDGEQIFVSLIFLFLICRLPSIFLSEL